MVVSALLYHRQKLKYSDKRLMTVQGGINSLLAEKPLAGPGSGRGSHLLQSAEAPRVKREMMSMERQQTTNNNSMTVNSGLAGGAKSRW